MVGERAAQRGQLKFSPTAARQPTSRPTSRQIPQQPTSCLPAWLTKDELLGHPTPHAYIQLGQQLAPRHARLVICLRQLRHHAQRHACKVDGWPRQGRGDSRGSIGLVAVTKQSTGSPRVVWLHGGSCIRCCCCTPAPPAASQPPARRRHAAGASTHPWAPQWPCAPDALRLCSAPPGRAPPRGRQSACGSSR